MDRLPLRDLTWKYLRKIPNIKSFYCFFQCMYCLIVLCLVSNIYQLLHTSANIKHFYHFEHLSFWGYFLAASSFSAWSSWYWSLVLSFGLAFKDELHSSAWGGSLTQHFGLVQRWVQAQCWPSDDGLFAMPWFRAQHWAAPQGRSCCLHNASGNPHVCFHLPIDRVTPCVTPTGIRLVLNV